MIPKIDVDIGITVYTTKHLGINGKIKVDSKDFLVTEVLSDDALSKINLDSGYAVFLLKKHDIDTNRALKYIRQDTNTKVKALGLKDAAAVTQQYVCSTRKIKGFEYKSSRYSLDHIGYSFRPLSKKDMIGNEFKIKITDGRDLSLFDEYNRIVNFYGYQRFGSKRAVTHLIGKAIIKRDWDLAVEYILGYISEYDSKQNNKIRQMLQGDINKEILEQIPKQMDIEKTIAIQLVNGSSSKKALSVLPVWLKRFYVSAYQSFLFNKTASMAYEQSQELFASQQGDVCFDAESKIVKYSDVKQRLAIPQIGYAYYKKTRFEPYIQEILKQQDITSKDFYIKDLQEASGEGGFREAAINVKKYDTSHDIISFVLSRGSYATILLREVMKPQNPLDCGF